MINSNNIDIYTLSATIAIAVLGWLVALWQQGRNIKQQHKVEVKYEIYRQFVQLRKEVQDAIIKLGTHSSPPFALMDSCMVPFQVGLKKEYKGTWLPYNEQECLFEGEKKWTEFAQGLYNFYSDFSEKFLKIMSVTEDWEAALEPILPSKKVLYEEVENLKKNIYENLQILQMFGAKNGHDWRKWSHRDIEKATQNVKEDAMSIGSYLHDFMVLIHNELLSSYFGHKRQTRKTLDPQYKVLTKNGIVENVDWGMLKKSEAWTEELISYAKEQLQKFGPPHGNISAEYEKFLNSIAGGTCPNCNTPIFVMKKESSKDSFGFHYACGHSWKGISIQETIGVKELYKIKSMRKGFGLVRRIVQGWKPSGDPKLEHGVDVYMDVNREKNEYHQIVNDHKTKAVLHEEHELLTEHGQKK